jgi:probable addiction module antidote protein
MKNLKRENILKRTESFHDHLRETLNDPQKAELYLAIALEEYQEDGDMKMFMSALRDVAEARGGIGDLAKKTELNRQSLYTTLSAKGNPTLSTLGAMLKALGFCLSVRAINS